MPQQRGPFRFRSADGTEIVGWRNGGSGLPVVLSNGLGMPPECWPSLIGPDSGFDVVTFNYRGMYGSARPADPTRVRVEDHVADLEALFAHEGIERAVVASWSIGVNVACEFTRRHPEKVAGLMAVAGVPGGTFSSMLAPLGVPPRLREKGAFAMVRATRLLAPWLNRLARAVPKHELVAWLIAHTGFVMPTARARDVLPIMTQYFESDLAWYFDLALAAGEHRAPDLSGLRLPLTAIGGRWDVLTAAQAVEAFARTVPGARYLTLPGAHYLPLEHPKEIARELRELAARCDLEGRSFRSA